MRRLKELSTTVRQALSKGGVLSSEILDGAEVNAELAELKALSPTPQAGTELLERAAVMEQAGVAPKDILIRTAYFTEGGDYGQANIDFFSAKLPAQKAEESNPATPGCTSKPTPPGTAHAWIGSALLSSAPLSMQEKS